MKGNHKANVELAAELKTNGKARPRGVYFWGAGGTRLQRYLTQGVKFSECYGAIQGGWGVKIVNFCVTYILNGPIVVRPKKFDH